MYKNGIPAEYIARQAMRETASNHPPNNLVREDRQRTWNREWHREGELMPEGNVLATAFTEQSGLASKKRTVVKRVFS